MSTDLSTPPQRRSRPARWLWKTWFPDERHGPPTGVYSRLLRAVSQLGAWLGRSRLQAQGRAPALRIPTIAVGNTLVGGAGKTPACIAILEGLVAAGLRPGLLSRGYKTSPPLHRQSAPRLLLPGERAAPGWIGDEAYLIHARLDTPVAVHPDRYLAGQALLARLPSLDLLVLDDGLSQTSLRPSLRVLVLDERLRGNGLCLPAGPNRFPWPPPAEATPDYLLLRGDPCAEAVSSLLAQLAFEPIAGRLSMRPRAWLRESGAAALESLKARLGSLSSPVVWAVAGIARPERFFDSLLAMGIPVAQGLALDDHALHPWDSLRSALAGAAWPDLILTTEKDWAKFQTQDPGLPIDRVWALQLDHGIGADWLDLLVRRLQSPHGL